MRRALDPILLKSKPSRLLLVCLLVDLLFLQPYPCIPVVKGLSVASTYEFQRIEISYKCSPGHLGQDKPISISVPSLITLTYLTPFHSFRNVFL